MDTWLGLIFEIAILAFIGFLYYLYQKKRIIHHDCDEIFLKLEQLIYNIHCYIDTQDEIKMVQLNSYVEQLEKIRESQMLEDLITFTKTNESLPAPPCQELYHEIQQRVLFYTSDQI
ncbi:MAG: hypothetical protein HON90_12495 [Halobacteriovoraceae bacterium]|jgi:hypothetical protein|nr:hypothetical protein [Halobacteriovoraceae bacterium]